MRLRVRKGRGRLAAGLGALLIVAGAVGAWTATRSDGTPISAPTTVAATTGTIRQTVSATGTIEPAVQSTLSFTVSGTVDDVPAAVGDTSPRAPRWPRSTTPTCAAPWSWPRRRSTPRPSSSGRRRAPARPRPRSRRPRHRWRPPGQPGRGEGRPGRRDAALAHRRHRRRGHPARGDTVGSGSNVGVRGGPAAALRAAAGAQSGGTSAATGEVVVISTSARGSSTRASAAPTWPRSRRACRPRSPRPARPPGSSARSQSVGIVASTDLRQRAASRSSSRSPATRPACTPAASANVAIIVKQVDGRPDRARRRRCTPSGGPDLRLRRCKNGKQVSDLGDGRHDVRPEHPDHSAASRPATRSP